MCSIRILKARKKAELMGAGREEVVAGGQEQGSFGLFFYFLFFFQN